MKDTLIKTKNNLQGNNIKKDEAKIQINDLERMYNIKKKKEPPQNEDSINSLWNNFKRSNIWLIGVPEREEKEQEIGNLSEKIVKENFPNLVKEIGMQVQEAQRVPIMMDAKRPT